MFRTHTCGVLNKTNIGETVTLCGWVNVRRDLGKIIFIDLRDRYGLTQVMFDPSKQEPAWVVANNLRSEYVVQVTGVVVLRPETMINKKLATGEIELQAEQVKIISEAKTLPFPLDETQAVNEELRLKYRYLDLRRAKLQGNLVFRAKVIKFLRDWMTAKGFLEIETPILTASSPEGARDFLVPSRLQPGKFYALPQAPQQYKQLLMVGGLDKYFQIAPCFRDEDARADRSPGEFYQLDIETSFLSQEEFLQFIEPLFIELVQTLTDKKIQNIPFPRLSYREALERYGSDKPDLRYGYEFCDVTLQAKESEFEIFKQAECVKGICINEGANKLSRKMLEGELLTVVKEQQAKGLAYLKVTAKGLEGSLAKFFTSGQQAKLKEIFAGKEGDLLLLVADKKKIVLKALNALRRYLGEFLGVIDKNLISFAWIVDFPMYEFSEEEDKIVFCHNPFSMPKGEAEALAAKDPLEILAYQYDLVCNGLELGSGAVRNFSPDIMYKAFALAGYTKEDVKTQFSHMIEAFGFGAPPHCGMAPGIERLIMILLGESNIREVIAFPKNSKAQDLVVGAPGSVLPAQLAELGIALAKKPSLKK